MGEKGSYNYFELVKKHVKKKKQNKTAHTKTKKNTAAKFHAQKNHFEYLCRGQTEICCERLRNLKKGKTEILNKVAQNKLKRSLSYSVPLFNISL